jgi:hypothetical protein
MNSDGGQEALEGLYWRGEILQALYWMRGEGLAEDVDAGSLATFLVADATVIARQMARLAAEGYLEEAGSPGAPRYRLTDRGAAEGGRSFHDEFAGLMHRGHGECSDDCWCHDPAHAGEPCPSHPHGHHET